MIYRKTIIVVVSLFLVLPLLCGFDDIIRLPEFTDISGNWAEAYIEDAAVRGILVGFEDDTFRPSKSITRGEFVKLVVLSFSIPEVENASFTDIEGHWSEKYINAAFAAGIVRGITVSGFMPNRPISRQDALLILSRVEKYKGFALPETTAESVFIDEVYVRTECAETVRHFQKAGVINGKIGSLLDPIGSMTRAEAVKVIILTLRGLQTPMAV